MSLVGESVVIGQRSHDPPVLDFDGTGPRFGEVIDGKLMPSGSFRAVIVLDRPIPFPGGRRSEMIGLETTREQLAQLSRLGPMKYAFIIIEPVTSGTEFLEADVVGRSSERRGADLALSVNDLVDPQSRYVREMNAGISRLVAEYGSWEAVPDHAISADLRLRISALVDQHRLGGLSEDDIVMFQAILERGLGHEGVENSIAKCGQSGESSNTDGRFQ